MVKIPIRLDTLDSINEFVRICSTILGDVKLTDETGNFSVNGKSLLGCVYTMEWDKVYCCFEPDDDDKNKLDKFMI